MINEIFPYLILAGTALFGIIAVYFSVDPEAEKKTEEKKIITDLKTLHRHN